MSLTPKSAHILSGGGGGGGGGGTSNFNTGHGNNSNIVFSAISMNPNVLNNNFQCAPTTPTLTALPLATVLGPSVNKSQQQHQQQPQQFYHVIPIAASGVNTLQLASVGAGAGAAVANVPQCNVKIATSSSSSNNATIQANIAQIIGAALPMQNVVATNATVNKYGATIGKPALTAVVQTGLAPGINATGATIIQLPTGTANLQRVITPNVQAAQGGVVIAASSSPAQIQQVPTITTMSAAGTFSMINPHVNSKYQTSQFVISGGAPPKPATIKTTTTASPPTTTLKLNSQTIPTNLPAKTKIIEIKTMDADVKKSSAATATATTAVATLSKPQQQQTKLTAPPNLLQKLQNACEEAIEAIVPKSTPSSSPSPVASTTAPQPAKNKIEIDEINLQKLLPETTITKEPLSGGHAVSKAEILPNSSARISFAFDTASDNEADEADDANEDFDKSDDMLVIDDSCSDVETIDETDDDAQAQKVESVNDDKVAENCLVNQKKVQTTESPPRIRHISNSVVLTKADTSRGPGHARNLNAEPAANVVLMKLPNALQQSSGSSGVGVQLQQQHVGIPINEALTMSREDFEHKICQHAENPSAPHPISLIRSNSLPKAGNNLSPRAAKRSQSLNCGSGGGSDAADSSLEPSPTKSTKSNAENLTESNDELNKSNADEVTFIELDDDDDSFDEDYSNDAVDKKHADKQAHKKSKVDRNDNIKVEENKTKEKEAVVDNKRQQNSTPSNAKNQQKTQHHDDSDEQIIKSLLCNEQITATATSTSTSSSSSSSTAQDLSPETHSANNSRAKLAQKRQLSAASTSTTEKPPTTTSSSSTSSETAAATVAASSSSSKSAKVKIATSHSSAAASSSATVTTPNADARRICRENNIASTLSMVSTFDMLNWKEDRIGSARGTAMRFELNEFNLLQLHERNCPPRYRIHNSYERPIYERKFGLTPKSNDQAAADPVLYMCRKCKAYGPAVDFLAPEFCSYVCLRRTGVKRVATNSEAIENFTSKRSRKNLPSSGGGGGGSSNNNNNNATNQAQKSTPYAASNVSLPKFRWSSYLAAMRSAYAAPIDLFLNPFPTGPNPFSVGMKLEAIDPENCSLFCVCTVAQVQGYRMRLTFDGYDSAYDFWINADSMNIFPPGWCAKTQRQLQPPGHCSLSRPFNWYEYLRKMQAPAAEKKFFTHLNGNPLATMNRNPFQVGMFLEADDLNDTGKLCVASVADVLDERIRVHFDGWDDCYDYWVDISSPYIHPCGWHEGRQQLLVPPEYGNTSFSWRDYIQESNTGGQAAPDDFFVPRDPIDFRPGMKLEVVDPQNPSLIRPATVVHRTRHRVKIHFDCWPIDYTFVLEDDSPDLHPIGWCDATGHELEPPPGYLQFKEVMPCSTNGCRGIGNMNSSNGGSHATREACPYTIENWRSKCERTPRVEGKQILRRHNQTVSIYGAQTHAASVVQPQQQQQQQKKQQPPPQQQQQQQPPPMVKNAQRGRPRKVERQIGFIRHRKQQQQELAQEQQQEQQLTSAQIKTESNSNSNSISSPPPPANQPMPPQPVPQIKIEAVVSNGISAHKTNSLNSQPHPLEPELALVKRFLCDYGPRLQQNYALWRENLTNDITQKVQRNPLNWTTRQVCDFLKSVVVFKDKSSEKMSCDLALKFSKHDIDGPALLMLQQQDLLDTLELKLGTAVKICAIIMQLRILAATKYESSGASSENKSNNFSIASESDSNAVK